LHIFFDHSIVEVFAGDGELVMTAQVFSAPAARKIGLFSRGCRTKFSDLDIWEINSIW
jgi:fructan beta-fructosidase